MMLNTTLYPPLPTSDPITTTSFYPYPVSSRFTIHANLLGEPRSSGSLRGLAPLQSAQQQGQSASSRSPIAGPGPTSTSIRREALGRKRAEKRALSGRRPAGVGMAIDADELSEEEEVLSEERVSRTGCFAVMRGCDDLGLRCCDGAMLL